MRIKVKRSRISEILAEMEKRGAPLPAYKNYFSPFAFDEEPDEDETVEEMMTKPAVGFGPITDKLNKFLSQLSWQNFDDRDLLLITTDARALVLLMEKWYYANLFHVLKDEPLWLSNSGMDYSKATIWKTTHDIEDLVLTRYPYLNDSHMARGVKLLEVEEILKTPSEKIEIRVRRIPKPKSDL